MTECGLRQQQDGKMVISQVGPDRRNSVDRQPSTPPATYSSLFLFCMRHAATGQIVSVDYSEGAIELIDHHQLK